MQGLRDGFWPFEEGVWDPFDEDFPDNFASTPEDLEVIRAHRSKEVSAGRWSSPLPSTDLLYGMRASPMFVAWQKGKPRVITDHSASGLNEGIPRDQARVTYDDMRTFGQVLYVAKQANPGRPIITWKSDVASAFLNLPAHPLWQLRQLVSVDGVLYVVRRLVFGNRGSPRIWCSVSALLCWLAIRRLQIPGTHVYMDDFFGWDFADDVIFFHGQLRPRRQVLFLILWDHISCPYEDKKQLHGECLKIIGFWVDAKRGLISLPPDSVDDLIERIQEFLASPERRARLRDWQRLAGHLNWMLNVLPWGRPALSGMYRKMGDKVHTRGFVFLNREVREELLWLVDVIPRAIGVRFIDSLAWDDSEADLVLWTDAALRLGLSFYYSGNGFCYQIRPPPPGIVIDIFFLELVAIMSAIHYVATFQHPPRHVLLFTDSLDSVAVLSSLAASEAIHNAPLRGIAEVILASGVDVRVRHIAGVDNVRADMLSRLLIDDFRRRFPANRVHSFVPPRDLLPARWRTCF